MQDVYSIQDIKTGKITKVIYDEHLKKVIKTTSKINYVLIKTKLDLKKFGHNCGDDLFMEVFSEKIVLKKSKDNMENFRFCEKLYVESLENLEDITSFFTIDELTSGFVSAWRVLCIYNLLNFQK
ncbi:MAG: hypothetical protein RSB67_00990 [Clostridia bacterium]